MMFGRDHPCLLKGVTMATWRSRLKASMLVRNTEARKAKRQVALVIPDKMTVGGCTYEILSPPPDGGKMRFGNELIVLAKAMQAHLGKKDRVRILSNQKDIPKVLRGKIIFVFTDDPTPDDPDEYSCCYVYWNFGRWIGDRDELRVSSFFGSFRFLRKLRKGKVA